MAIETSAEARVTLKFGDASTRTYAMPVRTDINIEDFKTRINNTNAAFNVDSPTTPAEHAAKGIKNAFVASDYTPENPIQPTGISEVKLIVTETEEIYHYGVEQ